MLEVVVLGGGFCGAAVAKHLDKVKGLKVVLIDDEDFFEYTPGLVDM
ncbi:MAG: hypothetical protein GF334_11270 [Candidatus Altiarchaeales archaeon]|nr:hypothetical protein [Candidatus Altiarchaeales archaeon]